MKDKEIENCRKQLANFVESASHDLQAPLRKLSVLIDRVFTKHADQFDESAREYVARIESCVREMRSLIEGLTELAKAGSNNAGAGVCDLGMVIRESMEMMNEEIAETRAVINVSPLPVVHGNIVQYKQLFKNLLENAIKFRKKDRPIRIDVRTGLVSDEERQVLQLPSGKKYYRIEMSDNGIGFDQVYAERIFEPFVRLHSKSEYEGNGLGLSICKKIVANHNGIIYAMGKENEGSLFALILPETPHP